VPVEVKEIEHVVSQPIPPARLQVCLQIAEVGYAFLVFGYDLAVEQCLASVERPERCCDCWKALGPVERLPRQQANVIAVDARLDAVAIEFDLVNPLRSGWRLVNKERKARFNEGWQRT
jgi:hypothetical protein